MATTSWVCVLRMRSPSLIRTLRPVFNSDHTFTKKHAMDKNKQEVSDRENQIILLSLEGKVQGIIVWFYRGLFTLMTIMTRTQIFQKNMSNVQWHPDPLIWLFRRVFCQNKLKLAKKLRTSQRQQTPELGMSLRDTDAADLWQN